MRASVFEKDQRLRLSRNGPARSIGIAVAVGLAYFLAAWLSFGLRITPEKVIYWPAAGISSGVLISLWSIARWPVVAGMVVATIVVNLLQHFSVAATAVWVVGNTAEPLIIAGLIQHYFGANFTIDRLYRVLGLFAAAVAGTVVASTWWTIVYYWLFGLKEPTTAWLYWIISDLAGIVSVAPLVIGLAAAVRGPPPRQEAIESLAALAVLGAMTGVVVSLPPRLWETVLPAALVFPMLLWLAARCQPVFAAAGAFIVTMTVAATAIYGLGHFGDTGLSIGVRVLQTQTIILVVAFGTAVLAALFTERKLAEENQKTLTSELQHRTNNLLAVVQVIANHTLSGGYPLKEANEILGARLRALARANKPLTKLDWSGLTLREIIRSELEPFLARCEIEGIDIMLGRQYAQNFTLVLHELATNAAKYGALSNLDGRVNITWGTKGDGRDSQLIFHWREQGGPPVVAPKRQGFGSTLLRASFANARSNFETNGYSCEIEVPFREVTLFPPTSHAVARPRPASGFSTPPMKSSES
jgi:two-component sensor histidine kinase